MPARLVQRFACRFLFEGPVDWHGSSSSTTCRARSGARASRPRSARRQSGGAAVPVRARRVKTLGNCRAACAAATPPDAAVSPANHPSMRACRRLPLQLSASDGWAWASPRGCTTLLHKGAAAKRAPPIARARLDGRGHRGIPINQHPCSLPVEPNRSAGNTAAASASSDG